MTACNEKKAEQKDTLIVKDETNLICIERRQTKEGNDKLCPVTNAYRLQVTLCANSNTVNIRYEMSLLQGIAFIIYIYNEPLMRNRGT